MEHCQRAFDRAVAQRDQAPADLAWLLSARDAARADDTFLAWVTDVVRQTRQNLELPGEGTAPLGARP
jgi:hypothetical protein